MNAPEHINGGPLEDWHPRARALWATVNKMPPGHKIVSDHELLTMANAMRQQTALNDAFTSDFKARNRADDAMLTRLVKALVSFNKLLEHVRKPNSATQTQVIYEEARKLGAWLTELTDELEARTKAQNGEKQ